MGVTTKLVQTLLYIEMFALSILLIPIQKKIKKCLCDLVNTSKILRPLFHILYVLYLMIFLMLVDSSFKMYRPLFDYSYHTERNFYLTGFTLYLAFVNKMFVHTLLTLYKEEESVKILRKQIVNSKTFVESVLNKSDDKDTKIMELQNVIMDMTKELTSSEILLKQYRNNKDEYIKLLDKYDRLEEKMNRESRKSK